MVEDLNVREIALEIVESWEQRKTSGLFAAKHVLVNDAHLPLVHGFAAHVHELAADVLDLLDRGRVLTAYPLVRLLYECALTAQWAALNPGAPLGIANELARLQKGLSRDLSQATSHILREGSDGVPHKDAEKFVTAADAAARNFRDMCLDLLPVGVDGYVFYRMMSPESHASVQITDYYVRPLGDAEDRIALRHEASQPDGGILVGFTAYSMVWAGSAIDYLLAGRPRRPTLEGFALRLGIPAMLRLNPVAGQRQFELQKAAKEQARQDRRRRSRDTVSDS